VGSVLGSPFPGFHSISPSGVRRLVARLRRSEIASIIVESAGGYEQVRTEALRAAEFPVILVTPWADRKNKPRFRLEAR